MDQNPIHAEGYKNVFCPYYGDCLDHAVKYYWEYWACLECHHKNEQIPVTVVMLSPGSDYPYYPLSPWLEKEIKKLS